MSRFTAASRALRGPFKKLVHKLDLEVRRVVVNVHPKAAARYRDTPTHAETALRAAREEAAAIRAARLKPRPRAVTVAVDRLTGRVAGVAASGEVVDVPDDLRFLLPDATLEPWAATNCGEVTAAARAMANGAHLEDLVYRTVKVGSGKILVPCKNCITWTDLGA